MKCCKVESKGARHCCLGRDTNDKAHSTIHCHKTSHILPVTFHTFSSSHCSFRISREFLLSLCASMGYLKIFCLCFGSTRRLCTEISIYIYIYTLVARLHAGLMSVVLYTSVTLLSSIVMSRYKRHGSTLSVILGWLDKLLRY